MARPYSAQRATCVGLWQDRDNPERFFRVVEIEQDGYIAVGLAWYEGDVAATLWSCRTRFLPVNYRRVFRAMSNVK